MVQQMIVSTFFALGLLGKVFHLVLLGILTMGHLIIWQTMLMPLKMSNIVVIWKYILQIEIVYLSQQSVIFSHLSLMLMFT